MKPFLVLLLLLPAVFGECPNACSGHGRCGQYDQCECCINWMGQDCSERVCQFGQSHADVPAGDLNGDFTISGPTTTVITGSSLFVHGTTEQFPNTQSQEGHFYAECSAKGLCDRETGLCQCFTGYEGSSCQRASCPNACSGHGTCETIKELSEDKEMGDDVTTTDLSGNGGFDYELWDRFQTMGCKCDSGYEGADCSLKKCVYGVDPLYRGTTKYERAFVEIDDAADTAMSGTWDLVIYDNWGTKYVLDDLSYADYNTGAGSGFTTCAEIMAYFPNNRLQDTTIGGLQIPFCSVADSGNMGIKYTFEYNKGNPGYHKDLYVESFTQDDTSGTQDTAIVYSMGRQGEFADYVDSGTYDLVLPGYIWYALEDTSTGPGHLTFQASEDLSFWLMANSTSPESDRTEFIQINGNNYIIDTIDQTSNERIMYGTGTNTITKPISTITVFEDLRLPGLYGTIDHANGVGTKLTVSARLSPNYEYVSMCSNRGICNQETGLCECFAGYKTITCDTQTPFCC